MKATAKRLTLEDVRARGALKGFVLLSDEYIDNKKPLNWVCLNGHYRTSAFGDIQKISGCGKCIMAVEAESRALSLGFRLISKYNGALNNSVWLCQNNHTIEMRYNNIDQGQGCSVCAGCVKLTLSQAAARGKVYGFTLLSESYTSIATSMLWLCPNNHQVVKSLTGIEAGNRCTQCFGKAPLTVDVMKRKGLKVGLELLSDTIAPKLKWRCLEGHEFYKRMQAKVYGCMKCSGRVAHLIEDVRKVGLSKGFILLTEEYTNAHKPMLWRCPEGHETLKAYSDVRKGSSCGVCSRKHDKAQTELYQFILGMYPDALDNKSGFLKSKRLELDIYIPSISKAIELDGEYWHSKPQAIERDLRKNQECQEAGIELLRLGYTKHWKSGLWTSILLAFLGVK